MSRQGHLTSRTSGITESEDCMHNDVRSLREAAGMSQRALGEALGVSRQTINSIETGRYDPSLPLAITIARHFTTTVEEIFHVES